MMVFTAPFRHDGPERQILCSRLQALQRPIAKHQRPERQMVRLLDVLLRPEVGRGCLGPLAVASRCRPGMAESDATSKGHVRCFGAAQGSRGAAAASMLSGKLLLGRGFSRLVRWQAARQPHPQRLGIEHAAFQLCGTTANACLVESCDQEIFVPGTRRVGPAIERSRPSPMQRQQLLVSFAVWA